MRDREFCQRLKQIRQKYGYAETEKTQLPSHHMPQPTRNPSSAQHQPLKSVSFNQSFDVRQQPEISFERTFQRELKLDSSRSQYRISPMKSYHNHDISPRLKKDNPAEEAEPSRMYHRTSCNFDIGVEYQNKVDHIVSSPIKRLDQKLNFDSSPSKQTCPCPSNIPVLTLSPYNRTRPVSRQEQPLPKSGRQKYAQHIRKNPPSVGDKENANNSRRVKEAESQLMDNKFSYNINSIDKIQDKINSALRKIK